MRRETVRAEVGEVEEAHLDVRLVGEGAPQELHVFRVDVARHHLLARREIARHDAGTGAHLEDAPADVGAHQVPEERRVAPQHLDAPEGGVPLVLAPGVVPEREAEDGPQGRDGVLQPIFLPSEYCRPWYVTGTS